MIDLSNISICYNERLNELGRECEQELCAIGIPCSHIAVYNTYPTDRNEWGLCEKICDDWFIISINELLTQKQYEEGLRETIMHELLHTCPGCYDHGDMWKHYARIVSEKMGIYIKIHDTYLDKRIEISDYMKAYSYKYAIYCKECGTTYFRKRKSKLTENYRDYRCGRCGGALYERNA